MSAGGFRKAARIAIEDVGLMKAVEQAAGHFRDGRVQALSDLPEADDLRAHFKSIRTATLSDLDTHLSTFKTKAQAAGAQVHYAADAEAANQIVLDIARRCGALTAVKSKSMTTEEIRLNEHLEEGGVDPIETDLGEWIVQLAGEPPAHIIAPAIHKTREQIAALFAAESGEAVPSEIRDLTGHARRRLREYFLTAGIGISGGNLAVAETGSLVLVTNEGNGRMVTSLPRVHVAVIGIEKIAPTWDEAGVWLSLLARSATGQPLSIYTSVITGPAGEGEIDGPQEVHIVLLDNGRSRLLGTKYEEILQCIRCGACLNICPVYRTVGGHAYRGDSGPPSPYSGPIGAVITPLLFGLENYKDLPQASSLCGACKDVCPVRIDLPRMLVELRADMVRGGLDGLGASLLTRTAARALGSEAAITAAGRLGRLGQGWAGRSLPRLAARPFRELWETELGGGETSRAPAALPTRKEEMDETGEKRTAGNSVRLPSPWRSRRDYYDPLKRFKEALQAAHGEFFLTGELDEARLEADRILQDIGAETVVASAEAALLGWEPEQDAGWRLESLDDYRGDPEGWREICTRADAGITSGDALLAETGSLVTGSGSGRSRLVSLLPPVHIAIVPRGVLKTDIFTWLASHPGRWPANAVLISGPSKTGDIEQTLSVGVHGPRRLIVIVFS